jgi:hypothetical protein
LLFVVVVPQAWGPPPLDTQTPSSYATAHIGDFVESVHVSLVST